MIEWQSVQQTIQSCRRCEVEAVVHLHVPTGEKRKPPQEPVKPVRLYFVSVAPPWGGAYFWDETKRDAVREGLFRALSLALGEEITTCRQFRDMGFFLTPAVKCPSTRSNHDHPPHRQAVNNCVGFLLDELLSIQPERILALGKVPFLSLCKIFDISRDKSEDNVSVFHKKTWLVDLGEQKTPLGGTYFPGNNRHRGFSAIAQDIERILSLNPRGNDG